MTPAQARWLRERIAEGVRRHDELVAARQGLTDWPRAAFANPPALLVHTTAAMLAYYLAPDGTVYELDLDRFAQELEPISNPETIREVLAAAAAKHPELRQSSPSAR